jgi:hypothetical protein
VSALDGLALPVPELVDVVPVEQADAIIAVARRELADLAQEVDAARLAADTAEQQVAAHGADATLVGRTAEQVQRFIEERRAATDAELKAMLDQAADQAKARIEGARAEADHITADARRLAAGAPDPAVLSHVAEERPAIFPQYVLPEAEVETEVEAEAEVHAATPPGPSEPLWLPTPPAPPAPPTFTVPASVSTLLAGGEPATATTPAVVAPSPSTETSDATETSDDAVQLPPPPDPTPIPAGGPRLGSVPVFALLQVVGLVVVLVALLMFVN